MHKALVHRFASPGAKLSCWVARLAAPHAGLLLSLLPLTAAADVPASLPIPVNEADAITARWLDKPILGTRDLDDMEKPANWEHRGYGEMRFSTERSQDGVQAIRLVAPTISGKPSPDGRPFGEAELFRRFNGENWSDSNRLSFWVYPTLPGFKVISLLVKLHNEGAVKVPDNYGREGLNFFLLKPNEWNHVVWEIAHLSRDKVTGVSFVYRLQGNEPGATTTVTFDFDRLELQQVTPDHFEGWNVAPGKIALSQSGYAVGSAKSALASGLDATHFEVRRQDSGEALVSKPIRNAITPLGYYQTMDFSEIRQPGEYVLVVSNLVSRPFWIRENAWRDTAWKTLSFFRGERCGMAIPGVHDVCHQDWQATHAGRTLTINGGWHDAGDLSQGAVNTAEAVSAMLELADRLNHSGPDGSAPAAGSEAAQLATQLAQEAQWGLDWLRKTRFGDGHRVIWATMDYWTDNRLGTADDTQGQVANHPLENFLAAAAEARAARVLKVAAPQLATASLQDAVADWGFALAAGAPGDVERASAGMLAAIELWRATGEKAYLDHAVRLAGVVTASQQRQYPSWRMPLTGFFYTTPQRDRLLHYNHRGHEQAPIVALSELCRELPNHPDWMRWYSAVVLHSEYLRNAAKCTEPYGVLAAGVYKLSETQDADERAQITKGIQLSDDVYLRRFPVWSSFRGHYGVLLSQTRALAAAAQLRGSLGLVDLCQAQLQWVVGRNPFMQSTMYGEGFDYAPQYTALSGDLTGSLPVGIQTRAHEDAPYWPAANCYNYKEVWVHPSSRWLSLAAELDQQALVKVQTTKKFLSSVEVREVHGTPRFNVKPDRAGQLELRLPEGRYRITHGEQSQWVTTLPGRSYDLNLTTSCTFQADEITSTNNTVIIRLEAMGIGSHRFDVRAHNLEIKPWPQVLNLVSDNSSVVQWTGKVIDPKEPWVAVVIPDGNLERRQEIFHNTPQSGSR